MVTTFVVPTVAGCIDLVVHISAEAGGRQVAEMLVQAGVESVTRAGWPRVARARARLRRCTWQRRSACIR
jgi:hypothetical protein